MSAAPAQLGGLHGRKGAIAAGYDADMVVFDADAAFTLQQAHLHYRHAVSPYLGERLYGRVRATYLRGVKIFEEGSFPGFPAGKACNRVLNQSSFGILHGTADLSIALRSGRGDKG
jgi:allantoinase